VAVCERCGKNMGMFSFSSNCESCKATIEAEQQQRQAELLEERKKRLHDAAILKAKEMKSKVQSGKKLVLYETVYLAVNSVVMNEQLCDAFDLGVLRKLGLDGWDVVAVAPRTLGTALTNVSYGSSMGQIWGAGLGGNVIGVHVILKLEVTAENCHDKLLFNYALAHLDSL
jgi:hypothetical protein